MPETAIEPAPVTVMLALVSPTVVGEKRTSKVQLTPAAMVAPQVLFCTAYKPLFEAGTPRLPPLPPTTVTGNTALPPTVTAPNAWVDTDKLGGGAAVAVPDKVLLNVVFTPPADTTKLALALDVPAIGNVNVMVTLHVPEAASVVAEQPSAVLLNPVPLIAALKKLTAAGVMLVKVSV